MKPYEIEQRSMEIIESELDELGLLEDIPTEALPIVKRAIHASADFDYAKNLIFQNDAIASGLQALKASKTIISDTKMIQSGISKPALSYVSCTTANFISDPDVIQLAHDRGETRSKIAIQKAVNMYPDGIYLIGNAPTALIELHEQIKHKKAKPALVIACPVGFVNVIESKELFIADTCTPAIISRGRKGGSTIAVSLINALLYMCYKRF